MIRGAWFWGLGLMVSCLLGGCGESAAVEDSTPVPDASVQMEKVVGKYRLDYTEDEVEEAGGIEHVPTIFLNGVGRWNLAIDGEELKGDFSYEGGQVKMTTDGEEGEQVFVIQEGGARLVEDTAEDPLVWVKVVEGADSEAGGSEGDEE